MVGKLLMVVGIGSPSVVVTYFTNWVWDWGFRYTVFTLFFVYTVVYFTYWFFTDFWDNM